MMDLYDLKFVDDITMSFQKSERLI